MELEFYFNFDKLNREIAVATACNSSKLDLLDAVNRNIEELRKFDQETSKQLHKKRIEELEALTRMQLYLVELFKTKI
jgi:hypothetical protein